GVGVVAGGGVPVFGAPPDDALVAQDLEGDRVVAGFGEEVAAEAEHVCPAAKGLPVGVGAEGPAGVYQAFGVAAVGVGVQVDDLGGEPAGDVPGGLGALGGVLGQV